MGRIARLKVKGEPAVYHVISRTTLEGFVLGDVEKDYLLSLVRRLSEFYFAEVMGFSLMGNHFTCWFACILRMGIRNRK
jgi:putative transposase